MELAPAWVAGVSSGGAIALRLAHERPDLLRGVVVHEPGVERASFLDDANDPEALAFDPAWVEGFTKPTLLTVGERTPPMFGRMVSMLAEAMPTAKVHTFAGAGHVPHRTHPDAYVESVLDFIRVN